MAWRSVPPGGGDAALILVDSGKHFAGGALDPSDVWIEGHVVDYFLDTRTGALLPLPDVRVANWDRQGNFLLAYRSGELGIARLAGNKLETLWSASLNGDLPEQRRAAPRWAQSWDATE